MARSNQRSSTPEGVVQRMDDEVDRIETSRDPREYEPLLLDIEARTTLERQFDFLQRLDKVALVLVQLNAIIIGLFLAAASIGEGVPDIIGINEWAVIFGGLGLGSFRISAIFALVAFSVDDLTVGIGAGFFDKYNPESASSRELVQDLLERYPKWIDNNSNQISSDLKWMNRSGLALLFGLLFSLIAVVNVV